MQDWLVEGMESLNGLPGRVVEMSTPPAAVLARSDIALCLSGGVAVATGSTPIGFIPGAKLAKLLAAALTRAEREARDGRAAAEEVKRLRRDRRMLAANISHELRTPLSAISGYSELISLGLDRGQTVAAASQNAIIWEAAQSLLGTIDAMLDVARIEADAAQTEEVEFPLAPLTSTVVRMLATMAAARGVTVRTDVPDDLPAIVADPRMLRQILVNLVANAIKYGGANGLVTISARIDRRERMAIEVRDTGTGMTAKAITAAMQPFCRGVDQRNAKDALPGSGLGLPLVNALAELHEGAFQLLSSPGKGTRAIVTLPAGRVRLARPGRQEGFAFQRASDLFG